MKTKKALRYYKRPVAVFAAVCCGVACVLARTAYLQTGSRAELASQAASRYIGVGVSRGYIYDRSLLPLVNVSVENVAAVIVSDAARALLPASQAQELMKKNGVCVTFRTPGPVPETQFSKNVSVVSRYAEDQLCTHIIGYTDAEGRGVCGIEKSFDRILHAASGAIGVEYTANGRGLAIPGAGISIVNEHYNDPAGVVLTVDRAAQRITETALRSSNIKKGAAVVLEVQTGAVLAMASVPAYSVRDLAASLNDPALPFLNRALQAYPVGSVFKPFIAAAALEHGVACPSAYECGGAVNVSGVRFQCYHAAAHGQVDLSGAVSKSCNCYFIELGRRAGAEAILETAAAFGFGEAVRLTGDLRSAAGVLPREETLSSPAALANLSFGQGELLASPLQLAAAYAALANGGTYRAPYIAKALVDETKTEYAYYKNEVTRTAASEDTCAFLGYALRDNVREGTGKNGACGLFAAAGKTATAQTGRLLENGAEQLCTWFCGWFPYEAPKYAVVVFNEEGASASEDCAPVFRAITEGLYRAGL